jgi:anti-anti-sigma factor
MQLCDYSQDQALLTQDDALTLPGLDEPLVLPTQDDFRIWSKNGLPVVSTTVDIDYYSGPMLYRAIIAAAIPDAPVVVVDLSETTFCDCAGLGSLFHAYQRVGEGGVEVRVVSSNPRVQKTMAISKYDRDLLVFDNLAEAVAAATRARPSYHQAA